MVAMLARMMVAEMAELMAYSTVGWWVQSPKHCAKPSLAIILKGSS
jgi:hypothetical protein